MWHVAVRKIVAWILPMTSQNRNPHRPKGFVVVAPGKSFCSAVVCAIHFATGPSTV